MANQIVGNWSWNLSARISEQNMKKLPFIQKLLVGRENPQSQTISFI